MPDRSIPDTLDLPGLAKRLSTDELSWTPVPKGTDEYRDHRLVGPQDQVIFLDSYEDKGQPRVSVSAYPRRSDAEPYPYGYNGGRPETTVTLSRGMEALARAIERKILPRLAEAVEKVEQAEARQREYVDATDRTARLLTEAGITGLSAYLGDNDRRRSYTEVGSTSGVSVEVQGARVSLDFTTDSETALRVIRALEG